MILSSIVVSIILLLVSYTISHRNNYPRVYSSVNDEGESKSQYECGIEPLEEELGKETRERIYLKFYIVGILYLIFDLETILLLPASLCTTLHSPFSSITSIYEGNVESLGIYPVIFIFIVILLIGLYYEYSKNVL